MKRTGAMITLAALVTSMPALAQDALSNLCPTNPGLGDWQSEPSWNGWGAGATNARFQPAAGAQLTAEQVPKLRLKWAYGFAGSKTMNGQSTVVGGRVFLGVDTGSVYSIDAVSGCSYWSYRAAAPVRSAISIGPGRTPGESLAYFGDLKGSVYALNAANGELVWKKEVETHPAARITGAPALFRDRLYVPVASGEEILAAMPDYQCCTFRGSVVALDALTGRMVWKTSVIPTAPKPANANARGTQRFAPAGGGIWSSPTLDPQRHALYVGTGNAYTAPAPKTTDAILALDMDSGKVLWSVQDFSGDAWSRSCTATESGRGTRDNCPENAGPDYDFGASPMLKMLPNGKTILVAAQKSGIIWAHDPDQKGAVVWKASVATAKPTEQGQVNFGGSADDRKAYFGLFSGGIVALGLTDGARQWFTDLEPPTGRLRGQDAAVSTIPGVLFSAGWDGVLRALATTDGRILWTFDLARSFQTVNGIPANGGSLGSAGPTVAAGLVFVPSGTAGPAHGHPGNVLLAFGPQ
jgi:polyvinyl alcohol dehydrogenase (cytochrome)